MVCHRFIIKGKVQGVWYRAGAQTQAHDLSIVGYARNCNNGAVEVIACGEEDKIEIFKAWLWEGSARARVHDIIQETVQCDEYYDDFEIR